MSGRRSINESSGCVASPKQPAAHFDFKEVIKRQLTIPNILLNYIIGNGTSNFNISKYILNIQIQNTSDNSFVSTTTFLFSFS